MTATSPERLRSIIHEAAEILVERGWGKGEFINDAGQVCMIGAVRLAVGYSLLHDDDGNPYMMLIHDRFETEHVEYEVRDVLTSTLEHYGYWRGIAGFNDNDAEDMVQALAVFLAAEALPVEAWRTTQFP